MTQIEKTRKMWKYTEARYTYPDKTTRRAAPLEDSVQFDGELIDETDKAYLVGFGDNQAWVPKSHSTEVKSSGPYKAISMTIPQWVAEDLGLE